MRKRWSLQFKWTLAMWLAGAFFFAILALAAFFGLRRFVIGLIREETQTVAEMIAQRIDTEMWHLRHDVVYFISSNTDIADMLPSAGRMHAGATEEDDTRRIAEIDREWPQEEWEVLRTRYLDAGLNNICKELQGLARLPVDELFMTDRRGVVVASTGKTTDYYQADEEWWQRAFNGGLGSVYRTEMEFDESSQAEAWALSAPIFDAQGVVQGVVKVVVDKVASFRFLLNVFLGEGTCVGLLRSDGKDIFSLGFAKERGISFLEPLGRAVLSSRGHKNLILKAPGGRRFIGGWVRLDAGLLSQKYDVFAYCLKDYRQALVSFGRTSPWFFFLWGLAAFFFWFFSSWCARSFLAPLQRLRQGFEFLKKGFWEHQVEIRSGDELEELADDFNRTMEELRKNTVSRDYLGGILRQMSDVLIVSDARGRIQTVNKRACEVLESSEAGLIGCPLADFIGRKDRYIVNWGLKGVIDEGTLRDKRVTLIARSGREVSVYLGTRSLRDHDNNFSGLVCVAKDLTEITQLLDVLKESNQEVLRQKEELEKAFREQEEMREAMLNVLEDTTQSKRSLEATLEKLRETQGHLLQAEKMVSLGQMAAGVAHEINNPLFVISGEAEMLAAKPDLPSAVRDFLVLIREQLERVNDVTKRLLEFSRKREMTMMAVDVNALAAKAVDLLKYQTAAMARIELRCEFAPGPLTVKGDANQLIEVFVNLMINGVQAMEGRDGTLTVKTFCGIISSPVVAGLIPSGIGVSDKPVLRADYPYVHIQVMDTGCGIGPQDLAKVFDPFFSTKATGTGLGLSVCLGIIGNHSGDITVESGPGKGATFTVRLPTLEDVGAQEKEERRG